MNNRLIYGVLLTLMHFSATADTYRDALSAFNSGHFDVARQVVNQLADGHPDKEQMLQSIDSAVKAARTPDEYQLTVNQLEQQQEGQVFRSLDDPLLMEQLYTEVDRSSDHYVTKAIESGEDIDKVSAGSSITVDQQVALLRQKMVDEPMQLASSLPGLAENPQLDAAQIPPDRKSMTGVVEPAASTSEAGQCLSPEQIKSYFSQARTDAAAFAMDKARAIAKANEIRQQRAVARMRLEITAEVTAKIRRQLDGRFEKEVAARVAALSAGERKQQRDQLVNNRTGDAELLLARNFAGEGALGGGDSRAWLELAAVKGNAEAQFELGQWFFQPSSGEPDYLLAGSWWEQAKSNGHADASAALAMLRERQVAVDQGPGSAP